nr:type VI secretion system baseplate subunit TssG [Thetidibacter halocola]
MGDGPLHPATLARLATDTASLHRYPERALPTPDLRALYESLIADTDDLAEPIYVPPLPEKTPDREAQERAARGIGLFALLRHYERHAGDKPRIGRNLRLRDALVALGQDPFLMTPAGDLARFDPGAAPPMVRAQVLGFFGPFGALPLNWSEEIARWFRNGDEAFTAFADIFTARFQELFFRTWSDAHAITQFDHPTDDRFRTYLLSVMGNGTAAMRDRDGLPDTLRAGMAGLAAGAVKSPVRLQQMLSRHFRGKAQVDIEEMVPSWLEFESDAQNRLGMRSATLGRDMFLGARVRSVSERIRLHLHVARIEDYFNFLPGKPDHEHLRAIVFWYLGLAFEVELVLWLPRPQISPAVLGKTAQLGWMACIAPQPGNPDHLVRATAFVLKPPPPDDGEGAAFDRAA